MHFKLVKGLAAYFVCSTLLTSEEHSDLLVGSLWSHVSGLNERAHHNLVQSVSEFWPSVLGQRKIHLRILVHAKGHSN